MIIYIFLINLLFSFIQVSNTNSNFYQNNNVNQESKSIIINNKTYKSDIKTVLIYKKGWELSFPIINLHDDEEKIVLSFDELGNNINDYSWQIIHCNADWTKSELEPIDYLSGFFEGDIQNYQQSKNTTVNYINYKIEFPNEDVEFQKSGNYIIKIFAEDDPTNIILTRRFYIIEKKIELTGQINKIPLLNNSKNQQINFNIKYDNNIEGAQNNIISYIIKNGESSISTRNISPNKFALNIIGYQNIEKFSFAGGNEYRHFDIKSFKFSSSQVESIGYSSNVRQINLRIDETKKDIEYRFNNDINGKRLIKLENNENSNIEADYCNVTFRLKTALNLNKGNYYIFGELTDWQFLDEYKLIYNAKEQFYSVNVLLKQGYYNYHYIFKSEGFEIDELSQQFSVEGNKFQTENEYYILSYYKNPSEQYEELIGFKKIK